MEKYFVITASDGEHCMCAINEEELLGRINDEGYYGSEINFLDDVPDMDYMGNDDILIIKGEIIVPKAKAKVVEFIIE